MLTRFIDILFSIVGLAIFFVLYPFVAVLIKLDSPGPILYKCPRVGKDGVIFPMYKFRTMYEGGISSGQSVCPREDPRVTRVGRVLRRLKLNEFPQFLNIFRGEMTLVGPRPEAPDLAAAYPPEARRIFAVKPGLVGPNQVLGRNEEELYPPGVDAKEFYLKHILPRKIPVDLDYISKKSLLRDCKYLFLGVWVTITGVIRWQQIWPGSKRFFVAVVDSVLGLFSLLIAQCLRHETSMPAIISQGHLHFLLLAFFTRLPFLLYFGGHENRMPHFAREEVGPLAKAVLYGSFCLLVLSALMSFPGQYTAVISILDSLILLALVCGYRIGGGWLYQRFRKGRQKPRRVLIVGADEKGIQWLQFLGKNQETDYQILGFLDENPNLHQKYIQGKKVLGGHNELNNILPLYKIDEIFLSMPLGSHPYRKRIQDLCRKHSVKLNSSVSDETIAAPLNFSKQPSAYTL